jgi:hypothetical protein
MTSRTKFPLTYGTNIFGTIAAASTLICFFFTATSEKILGKMLAGTLLFTCLSALVLTDARAATVSTIFCITAAVWINKRPSRIKLAQALVLISPLIPFIAYRVFSWLNNSDAVGFLIRPGELGGRLGVGTGRGYIWESFAAHFENFEWVHLFGYGAFGHISSNISANYSWIFNSIGNTEMGAHNSFLQYLVDGGYTGAAFWLIFIFVLAMKINSASNTMPKPIKLSYLGLILLVVIQSQTEITGTVYSQEITYYLVCATIIAGFFNIKNARIE